MKVTRDEQEILGGGQGLALQKVMKTLVAYGQALGAERFVEIEEPGTPVNNSPWIKS